MIRWDHQIKEMHSADKEADDMKGYNTDNGYMGLIEGRYVLFASEADYEDYLAE